LVEAFPSLRNHTGLFLFLKYLFRINFIFFNQTCKNFLNTKIAFLQKKEVGLEFLILKLEQVKKVNFKMGSIRDFHVFFFIENSLILKMKTIYFTKTKVGFIYPNKLASFLLVPKIKFFEPGRVLVFFK